MVDGAEVLYACRSFYTYQGWAWAILGALGCCVAKAFLCRECEHCSQHCFASAVSCLMLLTRFYRYI